ncbi:hypothetical protein [Sphingobium yanoikuyae]|uniref:hypothetical protein n=1 Tax=Sphingobium yanoikuyae TaxID=13690 RepID=UPI00207BAC5B|nr:hypothetical protein [Sphingobium yanoikuyae]
MIAKYGWIWIGLTFGFAAKYALLIKRGVQIRPGLVLADFLLLPMVALIAYWLVSQAGLRGEGAALMTAAATVGADRVVKLYTDRFLRQVDAMIVDEAARRKAAIREEVQTELSANRTLEDIAAGKRPLSGEASPPA